MKQKSTKQILVEARKLIERPGNWCQGHLYEKRWFGLSRAYCMVGAIEAVAPSQGASARDALAIAGPGLATFNDSHTHTEVLAAFDRAIRKAA